MNEAVGPPGVNAGDGVGLNDTEPRNQSGFRGSDQREVTLLGCYFTTCR